MAKLSGTRIAVNGMPCAMDMRRPDDEDRPAGSITDIIQEMLDSKDVGPA